MKRTCGTRICVGRGDSRVAREGRLLALGLALAIGVGAAGCSSWQAANLYQSGTRALDSGAIEQAVAELQVAADLEPQRSEIRNHLGLAYAASGDVVAAAASFEAAVRIDCDNDAARRNLAALHAGALQRTSPADPDTKPRPGEPAHAPR